MVHTRIRKFNTKDTCPEQNLDNDPCQVVVARGTMIFVRGQCPQDLDQPRGSGQTCHHDAGRYRADEGPSRETTKTHPPLDITAQRWLQSGEERVIDLGFAGARGAVINLTVTKTGGGGGYVAVFPADIAWPGNSSINWTSANENIANGVTTALDSGGRIKIRGGASPTDVVIDRIGWLI